MSKDAKTDAKKDSKKPPKKFAPILLAVWYLGMFICTMGLHALGFITKDHSVDLYVALGIIAMLGVPLASAINAVIRHNELKKESAEREKQAAEKKREQLNAQRRQELENEKSKAAIEYAHRQADQSKTAKSA